jgi:type I restriction enzyme S subunit
MTQAVSLSDAVTLQRGFDLPTSQRKAGHYPVVTSTGMATTHNEYKVKAPGVVIGRSGSIGGGQYIEKDFWPLNTTLWVKDFKGNNEKFIYYLLKSIDFSSFNAGAAVPTLNRNHLSMLKVWIPDKDKQDEIANTLGSIDEKIELNRRMNETLEQMGQALFKHYFIANYEAKIWQEKSLDEVAEFLNGIAMQKYPRIDGEPTLPVIKIREMSSGITPNTDIASANIPEKYVVHDGDLLFSWSGTLLVKFWSEGEGSLNQHLFKVTSQKYPEWFYYYWLQHHLAEFIDTAKSKATTMGHIQRRHLSDAKVRLPDDAQLRKMSEEFSPLIQQLKTNQQEIQTLTTLRDTLLPRLISGNIKI